MGPFSLWETTRYMQYVAAISASLGAASTGMYTSWSSSTIPQLTFFSSSEKSWIASSFAMGAILGALLAGWLLDKLGRKRSILLAAFVLSIPWIAIALTDKAIVIIIFRFIAGIVGAIIPTVVPVYIAEIADTDIRGRLGIIYLLLNISGTVGMLSVGPFVQYKKLSFLGASLPIACFLTLLGLPESPHYLIRKNNRQAAKKSLLLLSAKNHNEKSIDDRLSQIEKTIVSNMKEKVSVKDILCKNNYRKPLLIVLALKSIQMFSGVQGINSYMETIMKLSGTSIPSEISSIIYGVIQIPSALIAAFLVDKLGRRPLLIVSTLGCATALICEGTYFYLDFLGNFDLSSLHWFPTFALTMYIVLVPVGISSLPYIFLGELFTTNIKSAAGTIVTVYGASMSFVVVKSFGPIVEAVGVHVLFWIYGCACLLGSLFGIFVLPETKRKSFEEIQEMLK